MTLKEHILNAVAGAVVLAGGAAIVSNKVDLARHDERIKRIEHLDNSMTDLSQKLGETNERLAKLEGEESRR